MMLTPWKIYCEGENLRGVLKHSWVEHDVERVSAEKAVERSLRNGGWHSLDVEFPVRIGQARRLADDLEEHFSPAQLVDRCVAFVGMAELAREQLKHAVHEAYLESSNIAQLRPLLVACLDEFEESMSEFRDSIRKCANTDRAVAYEAWDNVLATAAQLKSILNALPHGIVFP